MRLSNKLRGAKVIKVIVLIGVVFAKREENVFAILEIGRGSELEIVKSENDGEMEGVVRCVLCEGEVLFFRG